LKKYLDLTTIPEPKQRAKKESKLDYFEKYRKGVSQENAQYLGILSEKSDQRREFKLF
jgi:hypothetical protein